MSLFIFGYRRQFNIIESSRINAKLMDLRNKLLDLQNYSSSLASCSTEGGFSIRNLMEAPPSMFPRMVGLMQNMAIGAAFGAQQQYAYLAQTGALNGLVGQNGNAQYQSAMQQLVFSNLYKQQIKAQTDAETKKMNAQETKIQQEIASLETRLKMIESEDQKLEQAETEAAKKSAPSYGVG